MIWEGYELETGIYQGYEYGVVLPKEMAQGRPYLWRTEFFGAFPEVDLAMLEKGYAVVYYRISDLYGSQKAVELMEAFQPFVQEKYRLSAQAVLFGFSRGGLYALHYGAKRPERIAALYLDAPVVDIYSWPGGCFAAPGSPAEWEDCRKLWNMTHEQYMDALNAAVRVLLAWSVPLIIVAGGKDELVPYQENGLILQRAYEKSGAAFQLIMKPECGHHPHSLKDPAPVVDFLLKNRSYPTCGNALRINDQAKTQYPLTLIVHDREHLELVVWAESSFGGRYPLGYIGTSPWPGSVMNQRIMDYEDAQNRELYGFLRMQMEIGWVVYGLCAGQKEENDIRAMVRDMQKNCPEARQFWMKKRDEEISASVENILREYGVSIKEYGNQEETAGWLEELGEEIAREKPPVKYDTLDREWAEWTNFSVALPEEETDNRILLVGDSISAGYGDMVQRLMPGWHVDRLNTSEGLHHPNFIHLLEIALKRYPYRAIHINNGIHLHGQTVEEYGENLREVFGWIRENAPGTKIIFAATTPISRRLSGEELEDFDARHFSMGDRAPIKEGARNDTIWILDEKASEIYRRLNKEAFVVCESQNIPIDDLYQLCAEENLQKSDGVHFTEEAYWRLAHQVAETIRRELTGSF